MAHPFRDVAIAAVHNTRQGRRLEGEDSLSISLRAATDLLTGCAVDRRTIGAVFGPHSNELAYLLGLGPCVTGTGWMGIRTVVDAASAIRSGLCSAALVVAGGADLYTDRQATAPWTRPANEFVEAFGMFTAVEFALIARRHMVMFGTEPEQLATAAATIRNYGHVNPAAVYYGRGPFTPEDVLASRLVAEPFHLLDCAMTAEGGTALLLVSADRAQDMPTGGVFIHGVGIDQYGPSYQHAPVWDLTFAGSDEPLGYVGRRAARQAFATAGCRPQDIDVCELYDPFSFEIIRQFEAFGFCGDGEGGPFVASGVMAPDGALPTTTDGGTMSFSHGGGSVQMLQRVVRAVEQLQHRCQSSQLDSPELALCSNGGAGALFTDVMILGSERP